MWAILFISGDAATRERWRDALETRGRHTVALAPGSDARAASVSTLALEAIVIDVDVAVDWEHLRVLAENDRPLITAPLIVMTSWSASDGRYRQMAFRMGCDAFVAKPCTAEALLEVIERLSSGEREIHGH
jgi:DNA-binding NtrC family response regulator